jgi:DNA ligase-1
LRQLKEKGSLPSFVKVVDMVKCKGKCIILIVMATYSKTGSSHLKEYFDSIIAKGGEGVMLREPQSLYKSGRSNSLRKFKPYFDTEVKVIENNYPHGFNCSQYAQVLFLFANFSG